MSKELVRLLAEGEGFEPTGPVKVTVFKTVAIDRSATLPEVVLYHFYIQPTYFSILNSVH